MPSDVTRALTTPYATPLIFRTEVTPQLYLASAGLAVIGAVFIAYHLTTPDAGFTGILAATVGVFMVYVAWVNFWSTLGGYPHLVLRGHRLTVQSSGAIRKDLDLSRLGEAKIVSIYRRKSATQIHLGFLPGPGGRAKNSRFSWPELAPFADTVLLNGYIGTDATRAEAIAEVVNARRLAPATDSARPPAVPPLRQSAARIRLIATAAGFAALWIATIWWRLLP